ncbi:hypothetical protein [Streptomyces sp. NPDC005780]|uniref:hypothetical protein n=1 Tax=Streptomyces sp. NPDC005780 TaxID=3364730 RepID=UPI00368733A4
MGALRAGTAEAAELLGLAAGFGTPESGKRADVVIARGDPPDTSGPWATPRASSSS